MQSFPVENSEREWWKVGKTPIGNFGSIRDFQITELQ